MKNLVSKMKEFSALSLKVIPALAIGALAYGFGYEFPKEQKEAEQALQNAGYKIAKVDLEPVKVDQQNALRNKNGISEKFDQAHAFAAVDQNCKAVTGYVFSNCETGATFVLKQ